MKYNIKSLLIGLVTLGFILSCAQAPQQITEKTLAPTEKARESTVQLVSTDSNSKTLGSGFFVDKDKIATNIHVVAQPGPIFAELNGKEKTLKIVGVAAYDVKNNLVILKLAGEGTPLPLGDSDTIQSGDSVSIVGYPYGKYNVTTRSIDSIYKSNKWFWMKAFTAKGVSGGAALNAKGEVTGVYMGYGNDSHSYIIPSNILKALLTKSALIESLSEWQKQESIRSYAYLVQGYSKAKAGHYDEAISDLNKAIELYSEFPAAYYKRALIYSEQKEFEKAIVDFTNVIKQNPEDATAYQKRGRVKRRLGSSKSDIIQKLDLFTAAIDDYTHAVRLYPQYVTAYNNRGWVKYLIGKYGADGTIARQLYESAIDDYTQAIKIDPKYMPAHKNRGRAKAAVGDIESANGNPKAARILYKEGIAEYYKSADVGLQKTQLESVKGRESTVRVMCWAGTSSGFSYGSGFFVDYDKIVTNIHVVDKSGPVFVKLLDENTIWAVEGVIAFDVENDLVVLKIEGEGSPLTLGDSDVVEIGESVISVGYPSRRYEVLAGTVHGTKNGGKLLLTTIDSSPGSSGGPVLNSKNEVVGIHVRSDNFTSSAIPSNALKHLLNQSELMEPLEEWQKLDSILAYAYFGKAKNKSSAKEYKQAIIDFNKAIQLNPEFTRAYFERGFAKYKIRDYIGAIDDYTQAIKFNPQYAMAYNNRGNRIRSLATSKADQGNIEKAHEMFEAAIEDYTRAIQSYCKYAKAYNNMGKCRYFFGKSKEDQGNVVEAQRLYEAAIDDYTHAININPEYTTAYFNRGIQRRRLGASKADQGNIKEAQQLYQAAIDDYTQAIKLSPKYAMAYNNRGWAKYTFGQSKAGQGNVTEAQDFYQEAIDDYTQAITIDLEHPHAYYNLGWAKAALGDIVFAQGNPEKARSLYQSGIADYFKLADTNAQKSGLDSEKGRESTVRVMCWTGLSNGFPYGSGFFVDKDKIVTNIHVVARPGPVFAKLNDKKTIWAVEGVTAYDVEYDIVVLKLSGEGTPLPLGNSDTVQRGEPVVAVGYPDRKYKVSTGNVHGIRNRDKLLGTTAESAKGSSGGPVLNGKGEVIGITTRSDYYNFSVPSNRLKALLTQSGPPVPLAQWQKHPYIRAYAYHHEGESRFNAGDYAKAIVCFDNAILQNPKHILAYIWRGRAKTSLGQSKADQGNVAAAQSLYQAAIDDNTLTIKINPEFALAYNNRGWTQHKFGKSKASQGDVAAAQQLYQAAIDNCTRSIKIDPKYTFPYFQRGLTRTALGRSKADQGNITEAQQLYHEAIDDYTRAIQLIPKYAMAYNNRGWTKYNLGKSKEDQGNVAEAQLRYQAAIDDYTQAIEVDPKHVLAHYNRGNAKKALGQDEAAEKDFAKAKDLESK